MDKAAQDPLIRSFERHLRAENRSERTIATYLIGLRQADAFLRTQGTTLEAATRADLEAFLADVLTRRTASTAATYYKPLKLLYAWLAEEEEIPADPMRRMKRPMVPDKPIPIVPADGLKRLFRACTGNTFEARRDTALIMLLLDTGARRDEMAGLKLADVDLELDVLLVLGKGRRERTLPYGRKAGEALDRYLLLELDDSQRKYASLTYRVDGGTDIARILELPEAKRILAEHDVARLMAAGWFEDTATFALTTGPGPEAAA
jgi:site-specific recombinase XerD